jgi:hypothetical protein
MVLVVCRRSHWATCRAVSWGGGGGWQHGKKVSTDGIGKKVFRGCFLKALALPREGRVPFLGGHVAWGLGALRKG